MVAPGWDRCILAKAAAGAGGEAAQDPGLAVSRSCVQPRPCGSFPITPAWTTLVLMGT